MSKKNKIPPSKLIITVSGSNPKTKISGVVSVAHLTNGVIVLMNDLKELTGKSHRDIMTAIDTIDKGDVIEHSKESKGNVKCVITMGVRITHSQYIGKPSMTDLMNAISMVVDTIYKGFGVPHNSTYATVYELLEGDTE